MMVVSNTTASAPTMIVNTIRRTAGSMRSFWRGSLPVLLRVLTGSLLGCVSASS